MIPTKYPCFDLALEYARRGGTYNAVLAGADEAAVDLFMQRKIRFTDIADAIEETLKNHQVKLDFTVEDAMIAADWAYRSTYSRHDSD